MYYRSRERKRSPLVALFKLTLLVVLSGVLAIGVGIYTDYFDGTSFDIEVPALADAFKPPPTPTREPILDIADGDMYFAQGKIQDAVRAYERAIQSDPTNDVPFIRQARLLIYMRNSAKAVNRAEQAVLINPNSAENLAYYCRALDWEARFLDAFDACSCAIDTDPTYAQGYAFMAEVYADQGNWRAATDMAEQALALNYQSLDAHYNMGYTLEIRGQYQDALEFYSNAIRLAPNLGPLYVSQGQVHYALGDYDSAIESFRKGIRNNPYDPEAYNWLGWTYYVTGDYIRAIDAYEQSIAVDPAYLGSRRGTSPWGNMALAYYARQNFEEAIQLFPKALELAENDFVRRARRVEIYTEVPTLIGPESIPVLRAQFEPPIEPMSSMSYQAAFEPVIYTSRLDFDAEEGCGASIVRSIQNQSSLLGPTQSMTATQLFNDASGTAHLDLSTGRLVIDLYDLPDPILSPYEIKVMFWPDREDSVGMFEPDANDVARINILFEEKLSAPIEYYYGLGLAYTYLEPRECNNAMPHLLKALDMDINAYNPAWAGIRRCPGFANTPPTPIPTFTPAPDN